MAQSISESLSEAIKVIADKSALNATTTNVIEAAIVELIDVNTNTYKIKYLGNIFTAYVSDKSTTYSVGDLVYVVVPNNDFTKEKIIIGYSSPRNDDTVTTGEAGYFYLKKSENLLPFEDMGLCTYNSSDTQTKKLSNSELSSFRNFFPEYLKNYKTFELSCKVKTTMPAEQRDMMGDYSMTVVLPLINNGNIIEKKVKLDTNNMIGSPYYYPSFTEQSVYITLEEDDELYLKDNYVPYIVYNVKDFKQAPNQPNDIFFKDIGFYAVNPVDMSKSNNYLLIDTHGSGQYFYDTGEESYKKKTLTPRLFIANKELDIDLTKTNSDGSFMYKCLWFRENPTINSASPGYNNAGGNGYEIISSTNFADDKISLVVNKEDIVLDTIYKCVVTYATKEDNGIILSETIKLINYNSKDSFSLFTSTGGTVYQKNEGDVNLICQIEKYNNMIIDENSNYKCLWEFYDDNLTLKYGKDDIFYKEVSAPTEVETGVYQIPISFRVSEINNSARIKCYLYYLHKSTTDNTVTQTYLGSREILLTTNNAGYQVIIENADVSYKYDAYGVAPTESNYDADILTIIEGIKPIKWKLSSSTVGELSEEAMREWTPVWYLPKQKSLIIPADSMKADAEASEDGDFLVFISDNNGKPYQEFYYTISKKYNYQYTNNFLKLELIKNQGKSNEERIMVTIDTLYFTKYGDGEANSSPYTAVITYNGYRYGARDYDGNVTKLRFISAKDASGNYQWFIHDDSDKQSPLKLFSNNGHKLEVSVYYKGNPMTQEYNCSWEMFDSSRNDPSFTIDKNGVLQIKEKWTSKDQIFNNIVKAKVEVLRTDDIPGSSTSIETIKPVIYAYYPIEISFIDKQISSTTKEGQTYYGVVENNIDPDIDGGFFKVVYNTDGTCPKYDSSSDFYCEDKTALDYQTYSYTWTASSNFTCTIQTNKGLGSNVCSLKPVDAFHSNDTKNWIKASLSFSEAQKAEFDIKINDYTDQINDYTNKINKNNEYISMLQDTLNVCETHNFNFEIYHDFLDARTDTFDELYKYQCAVEDILYKYKGNVPFGSIMAKVGAYEQEGTEQRLLDVLSEIENNILSQQREKIAQCILSDTFEENLLKNYFINSVRIDTHTTATIDVEPELLSLVENYNNILLEYCEKFIRLHSKDREGLEAVINNYMMLPSLLSNYSDIDSSIYLAISQLIEEMYYIYYYDDGNGNYMPKITNYSNFEEKYLIIKQVIYQLTTRLVDTEGENVLLTQDINTLQSYITSLTDIEDSGFITHLRPILILTDTTGLGSMEGWDGNRLYMNDNKGYIAGVQFGAGKRESDGSYTCVTMGLHTDIGDSSPSGEVTEKKRVGLFGMHKNLRTFFLNAENGSALFGKFNSGGQIVIDPTQNKALLYSHNFFKNYNDDYLPNSYGSGNYNGEGMLIDLSTPEIRFGSGNFIVSKEGHLTAKGGGSIAGWKIGNDELVSSNKAVGMNSNKDSDSNIAFWAGYSGTGSKNKSKFYVTHGGKMHAQDAEIKGKITATSGTIGGLTLTSNSMRYKKTSWEDTYHEGIYFGPEGFYIGKGGGISGDNLVSEDCSFYVYGPEAESVKQGNHDPGEMYSAKAIIGRFQIDDEWIWINASDDNVAGTKTEVKYGGVGIHIPSAKSGIAFCAGVPKDANGNYEPEKAAFKVYHSGKVCCGDITSGDIYCDYLNYYDYNQRKK